MQILPPNTPYFKVHYNKKGVVPSGVSEDIYVTFEPNDYKYYYDHIRIHCDGQNLLVPVHGFPVINGESDQLLPAHVDFGTVSKPHAEKRLQVKCTSPVTFEYQIEWIKPHPNISIEPTNGEILPNSVTEILVNYDPVDSTTATAEFKFITTEFEAEPLVV